MSIRTIFDEIGDHNREVARRVGGLAEASRTRSALVSDTINSIKAAVRENTELICAHLDTLNEQLRDGFLRDAVEADMLSETVQSGERLSPMAMPPAPTIVVPAGPAEPDDAAIRSMAAKLAPVTYEVRIAA